MPDLSPRDPGPCSRASVVTRSPRDHLVVAALPIIAAIGVFGVLYGATARPVLGLPLTVLSAAVMFSGAAQFTAIGLLAAGASPVAVLVAVTALALRHVPLGVLLRPRLRGGTTSRMTTGLFLLDETVGLALVRPEPAERVLTTVGGLAYLISLLGVIAGAFGVSVAAVEPLADVLFPVLFVGLAALTVRGRGDLMRGLAAGACALVVALAWPAAGAVGAVVVAVLVAAVPGRQPSSPAVTAANAEVAV